MEAKLVVCLALIAASSAGPTRRNFDDDSNSCALECKANPTKFRYTPDTTYIYDYSVETDTTMAGAAKDAAKLSIKAQAEIQSIDGCEFALSLKNVRVSHSDAYSKDLKIADRGDEFSQAIERTSLRFSFDDGVISSVCPDQDEVSWVLNFKRGLLSAFQSSMENLETDHTTQEVDVTGECDAEFNVSKSWGAWNKDVTIVKSKNLLACSKRDGYKSFIQTTPYKVPSEVQSLPIVQSTHKCEYTISSSKVLKTASCEETHMYVPFSNRESGGKTKVLQKLTMVTQKSGVDAGRDSISTRTTLLFEHSNVHAEFENSREAAEQVIKEICEQTRDDLRPETPRLFSKLVSAIKVLDASDLQQLYRALKDGTLCPKNGRTIKFFKDALPMAETSGPVEVMGSLIKNGEVQGILAKAWLTSLALIQNPTKTIISVGADLLSGSSYEDAVLPVTGMVNNYCKKNPACGTESSVINVISILTSKISRCAVNNKNLGSVLKTLRALGNVGRGGAITTALDNCLKSKNVPVEIRAAAADAYRNVPCGDDFDQTDDQLWTILNDQAQEFELRIFTYLAVMRCPTQANLNKITQLLETEKNDQVGSYVTSHLNNLKQTSDPHKQDIAEAVGKLTYKEFQVSALKYSKNFEASFLLNKLNLGLVADSDVIMSPESPIPRVAKANLTVELFGSSINVFEVGGRVEGLEFLVDKLLGPYGYFSTANKNTDNMKDVKGYAYARLFGNELFFHHILGSESLQKTGKLPNFLDLLIMLSNRQEVAYSHSQQIMDVSLVIPTIAGLPLNISVNGSINFDLKAEGKADLRQVASTPRSLEIDGEFKPSAALEITGTMSIDAFIAKLGLRMRNTMHSSTGIKGRIEMNRGRQLSVEIEPPRDKMEIFNAKSQFFIIHNEVEKEQEMIKANRKVYKWCTGSKVATILGVEFCGEVQYPNASHLANSPYFPLTGPTSVSFTSYQRDTHSSYKLFAKRVENQRQSVAQFLMNTPGSKVNRMISTDVTIDYSPLQVDVTVISPWKKLNFNSALVANKEIYSMVGSVLVDDIDKYGVTTEAKISKKGNSYVYNPLIQVVYKSTSNNLLSGQIQVDLDKKIQADVLLEGFNKERYNVKGDLTFTDKEKRLRTSLNVGDKDDYVINIGTGFSGKDLRNFQVSPELVVKTPEKVLIALTGTGDYKANKQANTNLTLSIYKQKPATFSLKFKNGPKSKLSMKLKSAPASGDLTANINFNKNGMSSIVRATYNIPLLGKDSLKLDSKYTDKSKNTLSSYIVSSDLSWTQRKNYNLGLNLAVDHKEKSSQTDVSVNYGANPKDLKKTVTFNYIYKSKAMARKNAEFDLEVKAAVPEQDISSSLKYSHKHTQSELDSTLNFRFAPYLEKDIFAAVKLNDNGENGLTKLAGQANVGVNGRKYFLSTDLNQMSSSKYVHSADLSTSTGSKHSINTVYNMKNKDYDISSNINLAGYKSMNLKGNLSLNSANPGVLVGATYGKDAYSLSLQSKYIPSQAGKISLELVHPERQILADAEAKYTNNKYDGAVSLNWDVARKSKSQVSMEGSYSNSNKRDSNEIIGTFKVTTPYENYEEVSSNVVLKADPQKYSTNGKLSWGSKSKITSKVTISRPISFSNAKVDIKTSTPFRLLREFEFGLDHSVDTDLITSLTGKLNEDTAELKISGDSNGDGYSNDLRATLNLKTTLRTVRDLSVELTHNDDSRTYKTNGAVVFNGDSYNAGLTVQHNAIGYSINHNGNVKLSWPTSAAEVSWTHENSDFNNVKCSLETTWSGRKQIMFTIDGSNSLNRNARSTQGNLGLKTPWTGLRSVSVSLDHQHQSNRLSHTWSIKKDNQDFGAYELLVELRNKGVNFKFLIDAPYYEKVHGQTTVDISRYPATASAWFEWSPSTRIDFDGSLSAPSTSNINLNTKLTTPFENFENVVIKASHKLEDSEYVTKALIDYSIRKTIQFENRVRNSGGTSSIQTKLTSPCRYFSSLNYGISLTRGNTYLQGSADFELLPLVKKYDGKLSVNYDGGEYEGKLALNTPLEVLPSFQLLSSRKIQDDGTKAVHIEMHLPPYDVYTYDTTYRNEAPYSLNIKVKTPFPDYDNLGLNLVHSPSDGGLLSQMQVVYMRRKEINSELKLSWNDRIEGSLTVNTPFRNYKSSKVTVSHDSNQQSVNTRGEATFGAQNVKVETSFTRTNDLTSGSTIVVVSGLPKVEGNFKLEGAYNNLKGDASFKVGSNGFTTGFSNAMKRGSYKSSFTMTSPYTKNLKLGYLHKDASSSKSTNIETSFDGQYGDQVGDAKLTVVSSGLKSGQISFSLNTPFENYETLTVNLNHEISKDKIIGQAKIESTLDEIGTIEISVNKDGPIENMVAGLSVKKDQKIIEEVSLETLLAGDEAHGKFTTKMYIPNLIVRIDHKGGLSDFTTKARLSLSDDTIDNQITFKNDGNTIDATGNVNYVIGSENHSHTATFHKEGTLSNMKLSFSKRSDGDEIKARTEFNNENKFKSLVILENLSDLLSYSGFELEHSGDFEKFLTSLKIYLNKDDIIAGRTTFYKYGGTRIEYSGELTTPFEGYKSSKIEYRHEGQDNRLSCNINLSYGDGQAISSDLIILKEQRKSLSFNVKTPFRGYEKLLLSGDYDDKRVNAKAILGNGIELTLAGITGTQYQLTTSFPNLKRAIINLNGELLDGNTDFTIISNDNKVEGRGIIRFTSLNDLEVSAALDSNVENMESLRFMVRNSDDEFDGKKAHVEVSWDEDQQVVLDGQYLTKTSGRSSKKESDVSLAMKLPLANLKDISIKFGNNFGAGKYDSKLIFELNKNKLVDADFSFGKDTNLVIRKPWPQEYTISHVLNGNNKDIDIYLNWNRENNANNIRIKSSLSFNNINQQLSLSVIHPTRTVGVEHKISNSPGVLVSSGKLYWDNKDDTKVSYDIKVNGDDKSYDGNFKLGLPTRSLGIKGSFKNTNDMKNADVSFAWDMDRDDSKMIGLSASVSGQDYTQADVTVRLPSDFQVNSAFTLNRGNTIFDSKTDISYSRDAKRTLTLFSKVKSMPMKSGRFFGGASSGFNYSVEVGVKHPETKVDVRFDSHMAKSPVLLTSSMGVKYLTSSRQVKNLALFAEINQIKKEISLIATTPSNSAAVNGKMLNDDPLNLELTGTVNGQESFRSKLDTADKSAKFIIGQPDSMLSFSAMYYNSTAIQMEIHRLNDNSATPDAALNLYLTSPRLLQSRISWKSDTLTNIRSWLTQQTREKNDAVKTFTRQLNFDISSELAAKYRDITGYFVDNMKEMFQDIEADLDALAIEINQIPQDTIRQKNRQYRSAYKSAIQTALEKLDAAKQYSVADSYRKSVTVRVESVLRQLDELARAFSQLVNSDLGLPSMNDIKAKVTSIGDYINTQAEYLKQRADSLTGNVDQLYQKVSEKVESLNKLDVVELKDVLKSVRKATYDKVPEFAQGVLKTGFDEVYHQANWAVKFMQVKENVRKQLKKAIDLLKDIVVEEIKEYMSDITALLRNPVTVFDPENGIIVLETPLPIDIERLDKMPELAEYYDSVRKFITKYTPNVDSITKISQNLWGKNSTDDILTQLDEYEPKRSKLILRADDFDDQW